MATNNSNATIETVRPAEQRTVQGPVSPEVRAYWDFHGDLTGDIFNTQSVVEGARALLALNFDTDDGAGMHVDTLLLDIDSKLQALVGRLNDSLNDFEAVSGRTVTSSA